MCSCYGKCSEREIRFKQLSSSYNYAIIDSKLAQVYIFNTENYTNNPKILEERWVEVRQLPYEVNNIKRIYVYLRQILKTPQI